MIRHLLRRFLGTRSGGSLLAERTYIDLALRSKYYLIIQYSLLLWMLGCGLCEYRG
jgi:hypothetical protein